MERGQKLGMQLCQEINNSANGTDKENLLYLCGLFSALAGVSAKHIGIEAVHTLLNYVAECTVITLGNAAAGSTIPSKTGIELIALERERQITKEGFTSAHDDLNDNKEMLFAAGCYVRHAIGDRGFTGEWPWDPEWFKPSSDPIRDLSKAGALIAAEIDRLIRLNNGQ